MSKFGVVKYKRGETGQVDYAVSRLSCNETVARFATRAQAEAGARVAEVRDAAHALLWKSEAGLHVSALLLALKDIERDDAVISRALASMQSAGEMKLGSDRIARLDREWREWL